MISKVLILLVVLAIASVADARGGKKPSAKTHRGWGTAYSGAFQINKTGRNACQFDVKKLDRHWNIYYAAMNGADWRAAGGNRGGRSNACGRCIQVTGVKGQTTRGHEIKPIIAKVVDECPSWACKKGSVDFSSVALKAITGYSWDKKRIVWKYVDCPTPGKKPSPKPSPKPSSKPSSKPSTDLSELQQSILDQLED